MPSNTSKYVVHALLQALWRQRVRSFNPPPAVPAAAPEAVPAAAVSVAPDAAAAAPETTTSHLALKHSDLNERWTAALSAVEPATAADAVAPAEAAEAENV